MCMLCNGYPTIMESLKFKLVVTLVLQLIFSFSFAATCKGQLLSIMDEDGNNSSSSIHVYIVYLQKPRHARLLSSQDLRAWHESFLPNNTLDSGEPRILYSYQRVTSGFSARLTAEEVRAMEVKEGFLHAQLEEMYQPETTYTPEFLKLSQMGNGAWHSTFQGQGKVIGVQDSGIPKDHPSFGDDGMPFKPTKWKGECPKTSQITCNNKIIGAGGFLNGKNVSAVYSGGHGTHVASIAAGNFVDNANVLGMAPGTASGMAPRAHLAIYKVCFNGCPGASILAGMEQAISDGVDVVNLSLGGKIGAKFHQSQVVIATMGAFMNGISSVTSAGNSGPRKSTLTKEAPWALLVGATSTDRRIRAIVKLGNGEELYGESAFQPSSFDSSLMLPIVFPGEFGNQAARYCQGGSLTNINVSKKIVLCSDGGSSEIDKGKEVLKNGGSAMIVMNAPSQGNTTNAHANWIPASHLNKDDSAKVLGYYRSNKKSAGGATATIIFKQTVFGQRPAPAVTYFSSRGPPIVNGGILKPDVVAPGLNILAAWPYEVGPKPTGTLRKTFNFDSGTSMASPHVAGIAALVKTKHPSWSPSFVQSAIITSARDVDLDGNAIFDENNNRTAGAFTTGAGLVNASNALDPGLVYSVTVDDYIGYVCGLGSYTDNQVSSIFNGKKISCSTVPKLSVFDVNYPSIMLNLKQNAQPMTIERTVTNVGEASSTYQARIKEPGGLTVSLSTYDLQFSRVDQEITYTITFTVKPSQKKRIYAEGKIEWVSNKHIVTTPIAIAWS